jgi:hypothetical protein
VTAALGLVAGCADQPRPPGPVLLVALDGVEPTVVRELLDEGRLPTLARFAREGVLGRLSTLTPTYSPVVWTTVATGVPARDHGVDFFVEERTGLPFTSESRRVPALWNLVSDGGLRVDCVGWWVTWPAEPVRGRMLASYAAQAQAHVLWKASYYDEDLEDQTWPPELWDELRERIVFAGDQAAVVEALRARFPAPPPLDEPVDLARLQQDLAWTFAADLSNLAVTESFLADSPGDLVLTYLSLPDVAGHRYWRYHRPQDFEYQVSAASIAALGDTLSLAYEHVDQALARLLAVCGPQWTVIVLSDHGMHADPETLDDPAAAVSGHHLDGPPGIVALLGPGIAALGDRLAEEPLGQVTDVAPLVLRMLGLGQPEHWPAVRGENRLAQVLTTEFAAAHPPRPVEPPDLDWLRDHPRRPPRAPNRTSSEEFLEAFESLGYFDGDRRPR